MANSVTTWEIPKAGHRENQQKGGEHNFAVKTETQLGCSTIHCTPKNVYEELYSEELRQQSKMFYHTERKLWLEEQKLKQELANADNIGDVENAANLQLKLDIIHQKMINLDIEFDFTDDYTSQ